MENDQESLWIGQYVLDEQGNPRPETDLLTWAAWYEAAERQIALSEFVWGKVLTIFLGLDCDHLACLNGYPSSPAYRPLLWETMVFGGKLNQKQQRYRSREEALKGHREIVKECRRVQGRLAVFWRLWTRLQVVSDHLKRKATP